MVVGDLLDELNNVQSLDSINEQSSIDMNFLEYHSLKLKLTAFLDFQDMPAYREFAPWNNSMNILLNIDTKGVSNLEGY